MSRLATIKQIFSASSLPPLESELILSFLLGKSREYILTYPEKTITPPVFKKFKELEAKRRKNLPIAYLTGHKEFYGLDFLVSPAVLVPRPETELTVEEIIKLLSSRVKKEGQKNKPKKTDIFNKRPLIIDLGTGSGAIIISVAAELKRLLPNAYRRSEFSAVDLSRAALKIANQNAARYKLSKKINFFSGNLLTPLKLTAQNNAAFDRDLIIAANLPYLTPAQIKKSPSIGREPRLALDGGRDGLKYYRELFGQLKKISYRSLILFCEIDPTQTKKITMAAKKHFPLAELEVKKDLAGRNRLLKITD